jgi:50S ribosomal subunit-associated GTPase HflX
MQLLTVLNKIDALDKKVVTRQTSKLLKLTNDVFVISAVSGEGMKDLLRRLNEIANDSEEKKRTKDISAGPWSP